MTEPFRLRLLRYHLTRIKLAYKYHQPINLIEELKQYWKYARNSTNQTEDSKS